MNDFWGKVRREFYFALWVALAGAVAGAGYALWAGLGWGPAVSWAITGAILASVVLTAIKLYLDL